MSVAAGMAQPRRVSGECVDGGIDEGRRHQAATQWLEALGYPAPQETVVNALLGYATRMYRRPSGFSADWKGMFIQAAPPERTRGGVILPIEDEQYVIVVEQ